MLKRFMVGGMLAAALVILPAAASAQTTCPPGLTGDDCSAYQFFFDGIAGLSSVEFNVFIENSTSTMGMTVTGAEASGTVRAVLAGGAISAVEVLLPEVTIPSMFGSATQAAAGYIFVDGTHFVGLGTSIDSLAWQSTPAGLTTLPLGTLFTEAVLASTWAREAENAATSDGQQAFVLSTTLTQNLTGMEALMAMGSAMGGSTGLPAGTDLSGVDLSAISPELGAMMGGMENTSATVETYAAIGFNSETGAPAFVGVRSTTTSDLSGMMGSLGGDAASALGGMSLETVTIASLGLDVVGFNNEVSITAPAGAAAMAADTSGILTGTASLGLPSMLTTYFTTQAALAMASGMEGMLGGLMGSNGAPTGDLGGLLGALTGEGTTGAQTGDLGGLLGALTGEGTPGAPTGDLGNLLGSLTGGQADSLGATSVTEAGTLAVGTPTTGRLASGEAQLYTFTANANETYTISMSSGEFDTFLAVLDGAGNPIFQNDDSDGTNSLLENVTLPAGTTTVRAGSFANFGTGTYTLLVTSGSGSTTSAQPTLAPAQPTLVPAATALASSSDGALLFEAVRAEGVDDSYTFQGTEGDVVTIDMVSEEFDTLLRLIDPSGVEIASDDDSGDSFNARIEAFELPATGEYTVVASSFGSFSIGAYTLTIAGVSGASQPAATEEPAATVEPAVTADASSVEGPLVIEGTRESGTDNDFPITASAGDTLTIGVVSIFDNQVRILNAAGEELGFDDDSGDEFNALLTFEVPETGDYTVRVGAFSSLSEGDFVLTIEGISTAAATTDVVADGDVIRQWASDASATSSYGEINWGPAQATGEPNTNGCGDISSAWASQSPSEVAALTVMFDTPVIPTEVNIYQTYNPGSITSIELVLEDGKRLIVPDSADPAGNTECPGVFTVDVTGQSETPVVGVTINLDQSDIGVWNEIDAVELVGVAG